MTYKSNFLFPTDPKSVGGPLEIFAAAAAGQGGQVGQVGHIGHIVVGHGRGIGHEVVGQGGGVGHGGCKGQGGATGQAGHEISGIAGQDSASLSDSRPGLLILCKSKNRRIPALAQKASFLKSKLWFSPSPFAMKSL